MKYLIGALAVTACSLGVAEDFALQPAEIMPLAAQGIVLDAVAMDDGVVAVGERGHVLLSNDHRQWRQASFVPTRATLTAVTRAGDRLFAVGHHGIIIASDDGGENWSLQLSDPGDSADADPNPYLDIVFVDEMRGAAVGAYGWLALTEDAGENWQIEFVGDLLADQELDDDFADDGAGDEFEDEGDEEEEGFDYSQDFSDFEDEIYYDYHLNAAVVLDSGRVVVLAEAGSAFLSDDAGASWRWIELPYTGSMFGAVVSGPDEILAFGLRGHVLRSTDAGESWEDLPTGVENSLLSGTVAADGQLMIVGANGQVLTYRGGSFSTSRHPDGEDLATILTADDGFVVGGEIGIGHWTP